MRKSVDILRYNIWLCFFVLIFLFSQVSYADPDIVAQNYASARSPGIQSCTFGYDLLAGDVSFNKTQITGALPYSLNYNAPLRQNLSAAKLFMQPEKSILGWSDNYQSYFIVQDISYQFKTYKRRSKYVSGVPGMVAENYDLILEDPYFKAKAITVRLPGENFEVLFLEKDNEIRRVYSADPFNILFEKKVDTVWEEASPDLGEYQLNRVGNNFIAVKNGIKYIVTNNSYRLLEPQTSEIMQNTYVMANKIDTWSTTSKSWSSYEIPPYANSNTVPYTGIVTTTSMDLYRISQINNQQGKIVNLKYDSRMNLMQVFDNYNNKLDFERGFHDASLGASQTIDESRLVTKVTYTAAQGGSQIATFNYTKYLNKVPSTGTDTAVFALVSSNSTLTGSYSYVNGMTELGAIKIYVAKKGRTPDSSYYFPVLREVKNSLGQVVQRWAITQNYRFFLNNDYDIAQTTITSYIPLPLGTAHESTTTYDDINKTISLTLRLADGNTTTASISSYVLEKKTISYGMSGYPCLTVIGKPVQDLTFSTDKSRLLKIKDQNNVVSMYEYDIQNRITSIIEAADTTLSRKTTYIYGVLNNNAANLFLTPTSVTTPNITITNVVNPRGQIVTQTQTSTQSGSTSKVTSYVYDETTTSKHFARLLSVDGPRAGTADKITYIYDNFGNLASQSQTVNGVARTTQYLGYNTFGVPERTVNPTGLVNQFVYNEDGTLKSQTTGVGGTTGTITGQTTSYTYNALKQKISETNSDGEVTQFTYDLADRLILQILPNGNRVQKTYYHTGVLASEKSLTSAGVVVAESYQYLDSKGFVSKTQQGNDPTRKYISYSYDNNGNQLQTTSAEGVIEKWSYDALNRVTSHTDGAGNVDTTDYDVNDNVILAKDALNAGTNPYSYRNGNTLTQEVNSDYGTKTYSYNEADQLTQRLHATRKCNFLNIDELGRVQRQECTQTDPNPAFYYNDIYSYDQTRFGRLDRVISDTPFGTDTLYNYDNYDRIIQKSQTTKGLNLWGGVATSLTVKYGYSIGGKLSSLTLPSGRKIGYSYNSAGQLTSLSQDSAVLLNNISYNAGGFMTGWKWGGGQAEYNITYDASKNGAIKKIINRPTAGGINYSIEYGYNKDGQITSLIRNEGTTVDNFTYDKVNRLTSESRGSYAINYSYDRNGNRRTLRATGVHQQASANVDYTYVGNRLTTWTKDGVAQPINYSEQGDLIQAMMIASIYDGAGRKLWQLSSTDIGFDTRYNHKNERTITTNNSNGGWEVAYKNAIQYVYDEQNHLIGEYDHQGNPLREYVWLGDQPVAAIYGNGANSKIYYIVADAQNTPRRLIDSTSQAIVWSWDSTAFGVGQPQGNITFNLRFPGQYYDAYSQLFYNHNRYYNPELGRYMEADPIGLEGGLNPYAYAGSNPVMNVDPSGLDFTTGFGGMLFETYNWATGNGFDWQNVKGAFQDGYNGQGSFNNQYANMAWAATNDLMNFGTLGGGTIIKNTVQLGVKQLDNVIQMTKFSSPKLEFRSIDFVGPPKMYGPYHRLGDSMENIQSIKNSKELFGNPPTNFFRSDIPKVKAYEGSLPNGAKGFEFYTPTKPNGGGYKPGTVRLWSEPNAIIRNDQAIIRCIVTKVGC
ncbi:hypothetical protein F901_03000 [Acinetobacter dispersus]|uniref:RHS repeat domain-containing protein n=1 Tax=Acinetobacter dispersus TaxID=70348 RepID=UPI0002CD97FA|nr:RHS repeat-associated core domain-containing protein [Acinetobacter dispersus]ENX51812.1 hypothetical protein F901_03000 [Acinetobacter dispersus]